MVEDTGGGARPDDRERTPLEIALVRAGRPALASGGQDRTTWDTDTLLAVFVELQKMREDADRWAKRVKAALDELEQPVIDYFDQEEKKGDKRRGRNIVLRREVWPKIVKDDLEENLPPDASKELLASVDEQARARLIEALAADPQTEHLVKSTYNGNTLRSWVLSDLQIDPETLMPVVPEHLKGMMTVVEKWRASVLKT